MSLFIKHPLFKSVLNTIMIIILSIFIAMFTAIATSMFVYYNENTVNDIKVPEDRDQMVIKKSINVNI